MKYKPFLSALNLMDPDVVSLIASAPTCSPLIS